MTGPGPTALTFVSLLSPHLHGFYTEFLALLSQRLELELRLIHPDWQDARRAVEATQIEAAWNGAAQVDGAFQCGLILQRHPAFVPVAAPVPLGQSRAEYATHVVVRRDSLARGFSDLGAARWVYNDPSSLSGYVALHAYASRLVLPPGFFGSPLWSGGHLASLDAVLSGHADVAGVDSTVFSAALRARPELRRSLRVLTTLGPYPAPPLTLRRTLPQALRDRIQAAVLEAHAPVPGEQVTGEPGAGQTLLHRAGFARFLAVSAATYLPLLEESDRAEQWRIRVPLSPTSQRSTHV